MPTKILVIFGAIVLGSLLLGSALVPHKPLPSNLRWDEITDSELGFRVVMPVTTERIEQIHETPNGDVEVVKLLADTGKAGELFMVMSVRVPDKPGRGLGQAKLLALGRRDVLKLCSKLEREIPIQHGNLNGIEINLVAKDGESVRTWLFATEQQVLHVSVQADKSRLDSREVQTFFQSFQLLAQQDADAP